LDTLATFSKEHVCDDRRQLEAWGPKVSEFICLTLRTEAVLLADAFALSRASVEEVVVELKAPPSAQPCKLRSVGEPLGAIRVPASRAPVVPDRIGVGSHCRARWFPTPLLGTPS
jgi:hypothetical protein